MKTSAAKSVVLSTCICLVAAALAMPGCTPPDPVFDVSTLVQNGAADDSTGWPVTLVSDDGPIEIYQPQPESLTGDLLKSRAAVSLTKTGAAPVFGAVWFSAHVVTDRDTRTVSLQAIAVGNVKFPNATADQQRQYAADIAARLTAVRITFPLDQLMASLDTAKQEKAEKLAIQTAPPHIIFSTTPATLISINGQPKLQPVDGVPGIFRVANTPFILLFDSGGKHYYLKAGPRWVTASDLPGPWADVPATSVPAPIVTEGNSLAAPPPAAAAPTPPTGTSAGPAAPKTVEIAPAAADAKVIVVTEPTELLVTAGNPQFTPFTGGSGGQLLYANNTESNLFLDQASHLYYVLLSGRWYSAAALDGPWTFVESDKLPPDFALIPADSPRGDVLAFVASTAAAHEAVLDAGIPQTTAISRTAGAGLAVAYDGQPQFKDIPECPGMAYAVNTPEQVLRVNGRYYCCHQAVWYESDSPAGPWIVSASIPPIIYTIPPSCPDYNVRYVYIYDYFPDYVTEGYLPGYNGTYVYGPSIVYGTGYDYPGWYGTAYFPPPSTWGFGAYYDPFADAWGFDSGLYFGDGIGWFGRPWNDRWWHDHPGERFGWHGWWGQAGYSHSHDIRDEFLNARKTGAFRADRPGELAARLPGGEYRSQPGWHNLYARAGNVSRNVPAEKLRTYESAHLSQGDRGNIFAGSNGDVYRKTSTGWERNAGANWTASERVPEADHDYRPAEQQHIERSYARPEAGLEQHFAARSMGEARSAAVSHFGGGRGGFRGGGGRGGGGRR